jgi:hypothetical protein
MALKNILQESPHELGGRNIQQIIAWAGDGQLRDASATATEFREYIELVPASLLADYCTQCLDGAFTDSGLVLQDLINEVGKRLGFEVDFGRYRGSQTAIGFDGIWKFPSGHQAVVEVKTTSAYQLRLETIAGYRKRLIEQGQLSASQSSALIIVGRDDTSDLEAQIRGSRHAWDVRLISIEALLRLLDVKEELEDPTIVNKIHEVLIPREFTKLDEIVELLFTTAADLRPEVQAQEERTTVDQVEAEASSDVASFAGVSLRRIETSIACPLIKHTRSSYASADGSAVVICKASRSYEERSYRFWFGFYVFQLEMIQRASRGFAAFQCGTPANLLLIPVEQFSQWTDQMNTTTVKSRVYWHVHISEDFKLIRKAGTKTVDLRPFLIA